MHITVLGDSLALGTGASSATGGFAFVAYRRLLATHPGSTIDNFAIGGATIADVLRLQVDRLRTSDANIVLICAGGNDVVRRTSRNAFAASYATALARIRTLRPAATIVCCGVPDVGLSPIFTGVESALIASLSHELDADVRAASARAHAVFVDLYGTTTRARHNTAKFLSDDRFHPSDAGYAALADVLTPALRAASARTQTGR